MMTQSKKYIKSNKESKIKTTTYSKKINNKNLTEIIEIKSESSTYVKINKPLNIILKPLNIKPKNHIDIKITEIDGSNDKKNLLNIAITDVDSSNDKKNLLNIEISDKIQNKNNSLIDSSTDLF